MGCIFLSSNSYRRGPIVLSGEPLLYLFSHRIPRRHFQPFYVLPSPILNNVVLFSWISDFSTLYERKLSDRRAVVVVGSCQREAGWGLKEGHGNCPSKRQSNCKIMRHNREDKSYRFLLSRSKLVFTPYDGTRLSKETWYLTKPKTIFITENP